MKKISGKWKIQRDLALKDLEKNICPIQRAGFETALQNKATREESQTDILEVVQAATEYASKINPEEGNDWFFHICRHVLKIHELKPELIKFDYQSDDSIRIEYPVIVNGKITQEQIVLLD